uniref:DUF4224 domain-containing protein n=1 Tax=Variovorax sp. BK018 TaxID=3450241 RepID=UPI004039E9D9
MHFHRNRLGTLDHVSPQLSCGGDSALFLTDTDLIKLTGYRWKSKQVRWLIDQAIPPAAARQAIRSAPTPIRT